MVVVIEGISDRALRRLLKNPLAQKIMYVGITNKGETDVCMQDDRYALYTGSLFDKRDYVELKYQEHAYVIMTGEFNRVIVE